FFYRQNLFLKFKFYSLGVSLPTLRLRLCGQGHAQKIHQNKNLLLWHALSSSCFAIFILLYF
ncbi:MAG: hypothetical protein RML38_11090, partial [Bacteroidia bacterium]|nr:hypothetical protein [Bacteroidia bacterium]